MFYFFFALLCQFLLVSNSDAYFIKKEKLIAPQSFNSTVRNIILLHDRHWPFFSRGESQDNDEQLFKRSIDDCGLVVSAVANPDFYRNGLFLIEGSGDAAPRDNDNQLPTQLSDFIFLEKRRANPIIALRDIYSHGGGYSRKVLPCDNRPVLHLIVEIYLLIDKLLKLGDADLESDLLQLLKVFSGIRKKISGTRKLLETADAEEIFFHRLLENFKSYDKAVRRFASSGATDFLINNAETREEVINFLLNKIREAAQNTKIMADTYQSVISDLHSLLLHQIGDIYKKILAIENLRPADFPRAIEFVRKLLTKRIKTEIGSKDRSLANRLVRFIVSEDFSQIIWIAVSGQTEESYLQDPTIFSVTDFLLTYLLSLQFIAKEQADDFLSLFRAMITGVVKPTFSRFFFSVAALFDIDIMINLLSISAGNGFKTIAIAAGAAHCREIRNFLVEKLGFYANEKEVTLHSFSSTS